MVCCVGSETSNVWQAVKIVLHPFHLKLIGTTHNNLQPQATSMEFMCHCVIEPLTAIVTMQRKEVEYALRAIPLGGFVAFPDDDPKLAEKYPKDDPNLLKNRPIKDRALVISAGIIANCIFAFSILCAQVCFVGT